MACLITSLAMATHCHPLQLGLVTDSFGDAGFVHETVNIGATDHDGDGVWYMCVCLHTGIY